MAGSSAANKWIIINYSVMGVRVCVYVYSWKDSGKIWFLVYYILKCFKFLIKCLYTYPSVHAWTIIQWESNVIAFITPLNTLSWQKFLPLIFSLYFFLNFFKKETKCNSLCWSHARKIIKLSDEMVNWFSDWLIYGPKAFYLFFVFI